MAVSERDLAREQSGLDALEEGLGRPPGRARRAWSLTWPKLAAVGLAVGIWQLVFLSGWREPYAFPPPLAVFRTLVSLLGSGRLWEALGVTARRALTGYLLAVVIGGLVGVAVARVRLLRIAVGSMITGLQTMPSIAWFPLAILLFRLSEQAITFVVVLGAAPSVANGIISGVDHVPPLLLRAGRMIGARGFALYRHVVVPAALPACVAGLKQGWAFAWRSLMAGELLVVIASQPSLGASLQYARELSDVESLMAYMIVILAVGIAVDAVFSKVDTTLRTRRGLVEAGN
ncbi:MAG: ABC transporter permease [Acidimicrobiales bacterium]